MIIEHAAIFTISGILLWRWSLDLSTSQQPPWNLFVQEVLMTSGALGHDPEGWEHGSMRIQWRTHSATGIVCAISRPNVVSDTSQTLEEVLAALSSACSLDLALPLSLSAQKERISTPKNGQSVGTSGWSLITQEIENRVACSLGNQKRSVGHPTTANLDTPREQINTDVSFEGCSMTVSTVAGTTHTKIPARKNIPENLSIPERSPKSALHAGSKNVANADVYRTAKKAPRQWDALTPFADTTELDFSETANNDDAKSANAPRDPLAMSYKPRYIVDSSRSLYNIPELTTPATDSTENYIDNILSRRFRTLLSKALTVEDLQPVLDAMREHLISKNVAQKVASDLCRALEDSLLGKKVAAFAGGVRAEVCRSMEALLIKLLTPKASSDLLSDIIGKHRGAKSATRPYIMTFVGVNGVGKSTNLSKVAFWLLQNDLKVLIAACDTFRAGAIEQLRVHAQNLSRLPNAHSKNTFGSSIELYEKGYGKDAASIAKGAIAYATAEGFQAVLIDTAGRMQDNEPLMRALGKLVAVNKPDRVIFVGEALVGNDALDQLLKFDRSLQKFSGMEGRSRGIDGILLTKFDTIDDKVGAAVSLTFATDCPLLFIGVGQTYGDLRTLKTASVVDALLT